MASDRWTRIWHGTDWARRGRSAFLNLAALFLIIGGCTPGSRIVQSEAPTKASQAREEPDLVVSAPCTRAEAEAWETQTATGDGSVLKAASCYVYLAETGADKASRLSDARAGRKLAESWVRRYRSSGLGHYLVAYLTGLEAENDPLRGIELVPVIEREARLAAELSPEVDHGGPDRMLGELYLKAPPFPVSVGDVEKAVACYQRAVGRAPDFPENRLGLTEALLEAGEAAEVCLQLKKVLNQMPPDTKMIPFWKKALTLLDRFCDIEDLK
jgi:tetratricopeptide (TPR) repeat protein